VKPTPTTVLAAVYTDLPDRRAADALSAYRKPYIEAVKAALGADEPRFNVGDTVIVDSPHTRGIPGAERARANFRGFHGDDKAVVVFDNGIQSVVDAAWLEPVTEEPTVAGAGDGSDERWEILRHSDGTKDGFIIRSTKPDALGQYPVVLSRRPRGSSLLDRVPPKLFKSRADARAWMAKRGMVEAPPDLTHLHALEEGLVREVRRLANARTPEEHKLRQVQVDQRRREITAEREHLGLPPEIPEPESDDALLDALGTPSRRNPAIPAVAGYDGAALTPGHADTRAARQARARLDRADTGTPLGAGNFGSATLVRDPDGTPWVVKQPVRVDRHGKAYTPERAKAYLLHEAGIANRVEATGNRAVPHTVFVDGPGWDFGLVREYGDDVDPAALTLDEIRKLEQDLLAVEAGGVQVDDDLLILRRFDGSLFIGDVGWWRVLNKPWGTGFKGPNTKLPGLLQRALEDHPDPRVKAALGWGEYAHATPDLRDSRADLVARFNADKPGFTTHLLRGPADAILARDAVGFPVRADVRRLIRDLARKMPAWDPEGDSFDQRNLGRVVLAGDSTGLDLPDPTDPYTVVPSD